MTKPPAPPLHFPPHGLPERIENLRVKTTGDQVYAYPPLIVGIGASAGGLEAFRSFFAHMPANDDFAFVLVQHLSPEHVSALAEIVSRSTSMEVVEATDGRRVLAKHVYVIPPDATLTIVNGELQVTTPAPPRPQRWPINTFFTSLAEDQGDCAVCIVLSGSGSDGARGLRAVKEHGGLTLAQAGFDHVALSGMPANATSTGLVDVVLRVEDMPARLLAYRKQMDTARKLHDGNGLGQDMGDQLQTVLRLLHAEVGHDFSQYKRSTLMRRIQRRMLVCQTETVVDYVAHLRQDRQEHQHLFREMLIGVTEFFRNPGAFATLTEKAIPAMLAGKGANDTVRVWVPGCATGEEAYSIAMLLREAIGPHGGPKVQIFATDIDSRSIEAARSGRYRAPLQGISPERQQRWFNKEGADFCVIRPIREMCIFSVHSIIKDPPFSRLDLVSCRNLLIYLNADLQSRLFHTFHYALRPGAFLLLGPSESLARSSEQFTVVDKKHRLYTRRQMSRAERGTSFPVPGPAAAYATTPALTNRGDTDERIDRGARRLMEKYTPAYVVINANQDVERFSGDTGRYLSPSSGSASLHVFSLLNKRLREPARALVRQAFDGAKAAVQEGLTVDIHGRAQMLRLISEPLTDGDGKVQWCVLAFDEAWGSHTAMHAQPDPESIRHEGDSSNRLEQELEALRSELRTTTELHESVVEELQSTNEEYQSVNEELQSTNEELETSREEMQSINEELHIVNAEAQSKNDALTRLNSDLRNLMESTQIATLFLDRDMRIGSYTPAMTDLFHLREGDIGRPITDISARVNYPELKEDVAQVLRHLGVTERMLYGRGDERTYLLRVRPYRTLDDVIDGTVLTFVDVSESLRHELERGQLAAIVDSSLDAVIGYTLEGTITSWNKSAERIFGYSAQQAMGQPLSMLLAADATEEAKIIFEFRTPGIRPDKFEATWKTRSDQAIPVSVSNSPVCNSMGKTIAGSLIARDISERRNAERHAHMMLGELNHRVKNTLASVQAIALQTLTASPSLDDFKTGFIARLKALSQTHNLLAQDAWEGVSLAALVRGELAPYEDEQGTSRVRLYGEDLKLSPRIALALSMAFHELTTNAMKYGALSNSKGTVDVSWAVRWVDQRSWLNLSWLESGGPAVITPTTHGFGTRLITGGLAYELDGEATLEFLPAGVRCTLVLPLSESGSVT
ncbi:chemotaxis protein CheB [Dyella acidiphila]|uniref:PAS domain S-box protein n=1 Tax=Dyella acidiphila TaxID=2775866 RepID=A0ABR9GBY6_9GAMM|nr:chemotaxis protein CheB [Dyella acidiphila]MBE1161564.1 PAS domain S-box protein [Dyella acidiphila]